MILEKETIYQNKPAAEMRFTIQRYNPDLGKYYYVNRDFYIDSKTLQTFDSETSTLIVKDNNQLS